MRLNGGIFYGRIPGLALASTRSTNGSRGQTIFRNSAAAPFLGPVPAYPNIIPASQIGSPFGPDVFVFDKDFKNPRTYQASVAVERQVGDDLAALVQYNHASGRNITRWLELQRRPNTAAPGRAASTAAPTASARSGPSPPPRRATTTASPSGSPSACRTTTSSR